MPSRVVGSPVLPSTLLRKSVSLPSWVQSQLQDERGYSRTSADRVSAMSEIWTPLCQTADPGVSEGALTQESPSRIIKCPGFSLEMCQTSGADASLADCSPGHKPIGFSSEQPQTLCGQVNVASDLTPIIGGATNQGTSVLGFERTGDNSSITSHPSSRSCHSVFPPILTARQTELPISLLGPNMSLPAWIQRIKEREREEAAHTQISAQTVPHSSAGSSSGAVAWASVPNKVGGFPHSPAQSSSHRPLGFSPDLPQVQGPPRRNAVVAFTYEPLGFASTLPQECGSPHSPVLNPSHGHLGFSPDLPQVQGLWDEDPKANPNQTPLKFSPFISREGYDGPVLGVTGIQSAAQALAESQDSNVPGTVSNQVAAPAFAESQVSGAVSNQVAAQALAESQDSNVPGTVSNQVAAPAFAESQVSGAVSNQVAAQALAEYQDSNVPGTVSNQVAAPAFAESQVSGAVSNQVAAQALAESQDSNVPATVSNQVAVPAFAESQVPGVISNQVAAYCAQVVSSCPITGHLRQDQPAMANPTDPATLWDSTPWVPVPTPCRHAMSDPCAVNHPHALLAFSPSAPVGQAIADDAQPTISGHTGNTAYFQLFDDEDVNGVDNGSDPDPCWDQPWEALPDSTLLSPDRCFTSVPQVAASGNLTPATSLLRRLPERPTPGGEVPRKRQVTWKVPLAASCSCCDALEVEKASAFPRSVFLGWPCLASPPMIWRVCRLLPYTTRQLSLVQPSPVCWSPLPQNDNMLDGTCSSDFLFMSAASYLPPAPFESRSPVILDKKVLATTLTACSGRSEGNVPGLLQPRWGESLHPDLDPDLRWGESPRPGPDLDLKIAGRLRPILESLRCSSSASCNRTDQDGRTSQGQLLPGATSQDVSNLEFSGFSMSRYRAGQGVTDKAQVQGVKLRKSLNPSPIRFRSLPRAEQGAIVQITQADVVRSMPGSAGASDSFGADKDQAGSARLIQGQQMNTIGLQSGDTAGDMPQVSGATSGAMPQVSGATSSDMPQVSGATSSEMLQGSGATSSDMPQVSGATPSDMPQVSGATSSEMLQGSGATSDELRGRQAQGTEAHGPSCLKSIRFSLPSHEGQGKSPGQGSAAQVGMTGAHKDQTGPKCTRPGSTGAHKDQAGPMCFLPGSKGAHKDQAGSGRESQVSKDASRSSGTLSSRQDVTGLRVRVMHLDAKVQVDCGRVRASRAPANRIKYSMKYDRSHNHLNPSPLGFSPEPATFQVPQPVGFNSELGSADSQTPPSGLNGQSMREVLRAQWGSDGVQMDRLRDTNQEPMGCWLGLTGFLGLKEVQPILCGFLGPDVLTWLSVGKASIATLYRVSRTLGACSKGIEQAIRGQVASSINWDSGLDRATPGQCADGQFRQGSPFPAHGISTASAASWLGAGVEAGHKDSVLPPNPFEDQKLAWFLLLKSDQLGSFINRAEVFRLIICGGAIGALAKIMLEGQCASSERSRPMPNQRTKVDSSRDRAVCPHHAKGFCRYGGTCKFLHQDPIPVGTPVPAVDKPSPDMKDSVCKHFAAGWCRRGNSCKFPHSVLSPEVKPELRSSGQEGPAVGHQLQKEKESISRFLSLAKMS